jgi:DNA-binding transcriptional LysR family regulator
MSTPGGASRFDPPQQIDAERDLTPAGEAYYAQAVRILSDLDDANRSVSERHGPPRGLLRVSLPVAFARLHVAIMPEFMKSCPGI